MLIHLVHAHLHTSTHLLLMLPVAATPAAACCCLLLLLLHVQWNGAVIGDREDFYPISDSADSV
jgi:hypothetical protein